MSKRGPHVQVLTHGYCFDGWVSAALFTHLRRSLGPCGSFDYRSLGYGPKLGELPKAWLSGDENALLDFRFSKSPRLGWYFDHHATAFRSEAERREVTTRASKAGGPHVFYDAKAPSCASVIAAAARDRFAVPLTGKEELLAWADKVDAARFDSADEAFFAEAPALVLAEIAERHGDTEFLRSYTAPLLERGLELAREPALLERSHAIRVTKQSYLDIVRAAGTLQGEIAVLDLSGRPPVPVAGKFATYVAFPEVRYSVALIPTRDQLKLGVGHNPFSGRPRGHDIGALCQAHGGGGHVMVGAVAFAKDDLAAARAAMQDIVAALAR